MKRSAMSLRRTGIALLVGSLAAAVATVPVSSAGAQPADESRRATAADSSHRARPAALREKGQDHPNGKAGKLPGKHSLRAPVTDENFYFVMADRSRTGLQITTPAGLRAGPTSTGSTQRTRASTTVVTSKDC